MANGFALSRRDDPPVVSRAARAGERRSARACLRPAAVLLLIPLLAGCATFAPTRLVEDQVGYSRALSESQKSQTLLNIIRIRYGDSPVFLNTTQIISAYQLQHNFSGALQLFSGGGGNLLSGSGGVQLQQTPTFTFQPVTGEGLAQSIIRPLSPTELLPLSLSGLPIDVLFRLAVQSVNGLQNSEMLASMNQYRSGSTGFFLLLVNLRRLQMAELLGVRLDSGTASNDPKSLAGRLILTIADSPDPDLHRIVVDTRTALGMSPKVSEAEIVYGRSALRRGQVAIVTRPILGVLQQVASEVQAPAEDINRGLTVDTINDTQILHRPAVITHSSLKRQPIAFAQVEYRRRWYWIATNDFDSKLAFSVVQLLLTLAQTNPASDTLVTIPAH
jgi:hypothetical protein